MSHSAVQRDPGLNQSWKRSILVSLGSVYFPYLLAGLVSFGIINQADAGTAMAIFPFGPGVLALYWVLAVLGSHAAGSELVVSLLGGVLTLVFVAAGARVARFRRSISIPVLAVFSILAFAAGFAMTALIRY